MRTKVAGKRAQDEWIRDRMRDYLRRAHRLDAKKLWTRGRVFRMLAIHYRCVDRLLGLQPTNGRSWAYPLTFRPSTFYPGSHSFNEAFGPIWRRTKAGPRNDLERRRWTIAQMAKQLRKASR